MTPIQLDPSVFAGSKRRPMIWVFLAIILGFLIVVAFVGLFLPGKSQAISFSAERRDFKSAVQLRESSLRFGSKKTPDKETLPIPDRLSAAPPEQLEAVRLRAVMFAENGVDVPPSDLALLKKSSNRVDRLVAQLYGKPKPSQDLAKTIAAQLPAAPFELTVARAYAQRLTGNKDAYAIFADRGALLRRGAVVIGIVLVLLGGLVAWCIVLGLRKAGELPVPAPKPSFSLATADQYAGKAALILFAYLMLGIMLAGWPSAVSGILLPVSLVLMVPAVLWAPFLGGTVSLADLGLTGKNLGRNIGLGFFFLLLEIPVAMAAGVAGTQLFKFLPPQHPASEQLMSSPTPLVLLSVLLSACVAAPFFEEVLFRGLFFPAMHRVTNVVLSVAVTSFSFAMLHPQGPALWAALASVGAFSCLAVRYTKSLVPSMVMHFGHNFLILMLALAYSS